MFERKCEKTIRKEERRADGYSYSYELIERKGRNMADFGMRLYSIRVNMTDDSGNVRMGEFTGLSF